MPTDDDDFDPEGPDPQEMDQDEATPSCETVECPRCGTDFFEEAEQCPACGTYISAEDRPPHVKWRWVIAVLLTILLMSSWIMLG